MTDWLAGKNALVVGGGSGIGRAVVDAFLAEGARIAVLERDEEKCALIRAELPSVVAIVGDATTADANQEAVEATMSAFGGLDVLVNCVGVFDFFVGIADLEPAIIDKAFDEMYAINVKSHIHSVKAALPALQASGGSVILAESTSSYYPETGGVLYVSSKFAVRGLVTALSYELAPSVRVNGVAPGGTLKTDLRGLSSLGMDSVRLHERLGGEEKRVAASPLNVAMGPEDHAWAFVYLASDRSRGVTGDVIHSDGGVAIKR